MRTLRAFGGLEAHFAYMDVPVALQQHSNPFDLSRFSGTPPGNQFSYQLSVSVYQLTKHLSQVCANQEVRARLEQKCKGRRRWQFGIRTLLGAMVVAALLSTGLVESYRQAMLGRRMAEQPRAQAVAVAAAARAAELEAFEESSRE